MSDERRIVGSISVCAGTSHFQDIKTLENIVSGYKRLGGKVPTQIEIALEAAKQGKAVEDSLNSACDGLFKFYVAEQQRCARESGFSNADEMYASKKNDPFGTNGQSYDMCVLKVERRWQLTNIDYTINFSNKESAARKYIEATASQILDLIAKYTKRKSKK